MEESKDPELQSSADRICNVLPFDHGHRQVWVGALLLIVLIFGAATVRCMARHGTFGAT